MLPRSSWKKLSFAAGVLSAALGCGSAAPIDIVAAEIAPALVGGDGAESEPDLGNPDMIASGEFEGLVDASWERGPVSEYCRSSFKACGGLLAGSWVVEDNCNPAIRTQDVLQQWGRARMSLDDAACWNAVHRLSWTWSGELKFEDGVAIDQRVKEQQVEVALTSACLTATLGMEPTDNIEPEVCELMEDEFTSCALASGTCMCTHRSVSGGEASGIYGVLGLSVAIGTPTTRYEYCVNGDRLLWREKEGAQRQVVLRRTVDAPPGTTDPVEMPR